MLLGSPSTSPFRTSRPPGGSVRPSIAAARERDGRVMAIVRAMGPRAEVVRGFLSLADAVLYGPAALGRRERELLAVATSEANGAEYSTAVHADLLKRLGGGPDAGERDRALVRF